MAVYVHTYSEEAYTALSGSQMSLASLSGKSLAALTILPSSAPQPTGCAVFAVSAAAAVFLEVKGHVSVEAEIAKAKSKLDRATEEVQRQRKLLGSEKFEQSASEAVRESERKKLQDAETEAENYKSTIAQFEKLALNEKS